MLFIHACVQMSLGLQNDVGFVSCTEAATIELNRLRPRLFQLSRSLSAQIYLLNCCWQLAAVPYRIWHTGSWCGVLAFCTARRKLGRMPPVPAIRSCTTSKGHWVTLSFAETKVLNFSLRSKSETLDPLCPSPYCSEIILYRGIYMPTIM